MEAEVRFRDGDKEVMLKYDIADLEDLNSHLLELDGWRVNDQPIEPDDEDQPEPQPAGPREQPWGVLDVSDEFGKPGETVTVEITGGTSIKVHGFHMGINYESNALEVVRFDFGSFLHAVTTKETRLASARILVRGDPGVGNVGGGLINIGFQFLGIRIDEDNLEDSELTGFAPPVIIPPDTSLALMEIRIKPNARKKKYLLRNWTHRLGKPRIHTMYTTDLLKGGLEPELYNGSITVT